MAGIYFHIPFCKQACYYCDFHFSTNTKVKDELIAAMHAEISLQRDYLNQPLSTIYFGGGTPSLLPSRDVAGLLASARQFNTVEAGAEITLEANPDDLSTEKLQEFRHVGINRLSIGIQSFDDRVLTYLNRAHDSSSAWRCVRDARACGFTNISIDLIYAIPGQGQKEWLANIERAIALSPEHISAYSLTIEEKTVFGRWTARGKMSPVSDDEASRDLEVLLDALEQNGYEQYEVSNFAKPGYYSRHNTSYWQRLPYLGIGPSAHSYNLQTRQYNVSNNHEYIRQLKAGIIPASMEKLSRHDHINEYLLTTLRTVWGSDLVMLKADFGFDILSLHKQYIQQLISNGMATLTGSRLKLTRKGRFLADRISSDLFVDGST